MKKLASLLTINGFVPTFAEELFKVFFFAFRPRLAFMKAKQNFAVATRVSVAN